MAADPTHDPVPETILTSAPSAGTGDAEDTAPDPATSETLPYVTDTWNDLVIYRCPACGYTTFRPDLIETHQVSCQALARTRPQPREPGASVAEAATPDDASDTAAAPPPSEEA